MVGSAASSDIRQDQMGNVQLPGPSKGKSEKGWMNEKGGKGEKGWKGEGDGKGGKGETDIQGREKGGRREGMEGWRLAFKSNKKQNVLRSRVAQD